MTITLVTALPKGVIYHTHIYLAWSSEENLVAALTAPFTPTSIEEGQLMGTSLS
jgi:hypothetical protein